MPENTASPSAPPEPLSPEQQQRLKQMPPLKDAPPFWTIGADKLDLTPEWARRRMFGHASPMVQVVSINGGIFDEGASEVFLYPMPKPPPSLPERQGLTDLFLRWHAEVLAHYYGQPSAA